MLRKVEIYNNVKDPDGKNSWSVKRVMTGTGIFHQFGVNYEEFETGPGNYSTAIIEKEDGTILNHPVEDIKFIIPATEVE